ncbi:hypothetical protein TH15_19500 [Thalassospira profundimaris]|uniref:Uncharacterized protein n=1 Tax=Thalassospira indica TaxID=1891279 RepID=A0ABN5NJW1_9PROT|nr:hypothetical protein DY252_10340 [Thalassospira indica]OAZ10003.1 hypothetical protein TH15_19500 [Thalassospira profundimaris]
MRIENAPSRCILTGGLEHLARRFDYSLILNNLSEFSICLFNRDQVKWSCMPDRGADPHRKKPDKSI